MTAPQPKGCANLVAEFAFAFILTVCAGVSLYLVGWLALLYLRRIL